jgi:hypothetical protein
MAVTTQNSDQIVNASDLVNGKKNPVIHDGKVRLARFTFTQSGDGDANSLVNLVNLRGGHVRILPTLSRINWAAFGASRTLDIGYKAYTKIDGSAGNASVDTIADGIDVSSAGAAALGTGTNALADGIEIEATGDITVQAKVLGGTIPNTTTLTGWIAYVRD